MNEKERAADAAAEQGIDLLELPDEQQSFGLKEGGEPRQFTLEEVLALAQRCLDGQESALLADTPQLAELLAAYPDIRELPQEVEEGIRAGKRPLEAYRAYENAQLRQALAAKKQNERNAAAPGSQTGDADDGELDELMQAFNSVFH